MLGLAFCVAFALAVHPSTFLFARAFGESDGAVIGPRCSLAASPALADDGLWLLPAAKQIVPFELVAAGYPDWPYRVHDVVVEVTCTAYSSTPDQTDSTPFITASLERVRPGIIALSRDLLRRYTPGAPFDYGDLVEIVGVGVFQVQDTMHRRWRRRADIWVESKDAAWTWGRQSVILARVDGLETEGSATPEPLSATKLEDGAGVQANDEPDVSSEIDADHEI
jgi:3D (Asp-Asp-Asp) domain-containing protein